MAAVPSKASPSRPTDPSSGADDVGVVERRRGAGEAPVAAPRAVRAGPGRGSGDLAHVQ